MFLWWIHWYVAASEESHPQNPEEIPDTGVSTEMEAEVEESAPEIYDINLGEVKSQTRHTVIFKKCGIILPESWKGSSVLGLFAYDLKT